MHVSVPVSVSVPTSLHWQQQEAIYPILVSLQQTSGSYSPEVPATDGAQCTTQTTVALGVSGISHANVGWTTQSRQNRVSLAWRHLTELFEPLAGFVRLGDDRGADLEEGVAGGGGRKHAG